VTFPKSDTATVEKLLKEWAFSTAYAGSAV
jgi:hypothetical protein